MLFRRALWCPMFLLALPATVSAQAVTIYDSAGFEPNGFAPGVLGSFFTGGGPVGQQGWLTTNVNQLLGIPAGNVQGATVQSGSQAFQVAGPRLLNDPMFSGQSFWFRNYPAPAAALNPVASGTPVIRVSFDQYVSGTGIVTTSDMPLVGLYMEGYSQATSEQGQVGSILLNLNNGVTATTISGNSVTTANNLYTRNVWHSISVDFNFASQTYRATLDGNLMSFGGGLVDVPFRASFGAIDRIAEYGIQAAYNSVSNGSTNNAYFDNFRVTGLGAVPEPSSLILVAGGAAVVGIRRRRRQGRPALA